MRKIGAHKHALARLQNEAIISHAKGTAPLFDPDKFVLVKAV